MWLFAISVYSTHTGFYSDEFDEYLTLCLIIMSLEYGSVVSIRLSIQPSLLFSVVPQNSERMRRNRNKIPSRVSFTYLVSFLLRKKDTLHYLDQFKMEFEDPSPDLRRILAARHEGPQRISRDGYSQTHCPWCATIPGKKGCHPRI